MEALKMVVPEQFVPFHSLRQTEPDPSDRKSVEVRESDAVDRERYSSDNGSGCSESGEASDSDRLDASHREILDKLKRHEERRDNERRPDVCDGELMPQSPPPPQRRKSTSPESGACESPRSQRSCSRSPSPGDHIKTQRPLGLLAQHGLKLHAPHHASPHSHPSLPPPPPVHGVRERFPFAPMPPPIMHERPTPADYFNHSLVLAAGSPYSIDRFPIPSPPPPTSGCSSTSSSGEPLQSAMSPAHHWSFEEQFKQLYEISDEPKRREFLDELFAFMQKRGTPVNRIPIMAKQTLDLYELFRLVVSKGGLVEVINKKLWREITKGLNLPSSITSAAFTLRTQYMKYLYPYECDKLKLSNPQELQAAIDGNRREGRRPSYGYEFSSMASFVPPSPAHLNGSFLNGLRPQSGLSPPLPIHLTGEDERSLPGTPTPSLRTNFERDARAMEAASRAMEEATKRMEAQRMEAVQRAVAVPNLPPNMPLGLPTSRPHDVNHRRPDPRHDASLRPADLRCVEPKHEPKDPDLPPPAKRHHSDDEDRPRSVDLQRDRLHERLSEHSIRERIVERLTSDPQELHRERMDVRERLTLPLPHPVGDPRLGDIRFGERMNDPRMMMAMGMPSAHLKITSRGDGRGDVDSSLVVSMEVNGVMYQGVLFAQPHLGPRRI